MDKGSAPAGAEVTLEPPAPRDATRAEKEEIVYADLDLASTAKNRQEIDYLKDRRPESYQLIAKKL